MAHPNSFKSRRTLTVGKISINNVDALQGTDVFRERSPANTKWVLRINDQDSASGTANNSVLIRNLSMLK